MTWILWALSLSSATSPAPPPAEAAPAAEAPSAPCAARFTFVGQPDCVQLTYVDGRTRVDNHCDAPLLVDRSVQPGASQPVPAGASTWVRDLSAFTMGLDGELYQAVAQLHECTPTCSPPTERSSPWAGTTTVTYDGP